MTCISCADAGSPAVWCRYVFVYPSPPLLFFTVSMISNLLFVLNFHLRMVRLWWRIAVVQSEEQSTSHHYNSKHCYSSCSDPVLRKSGVIFLNGARVTKVFQPLKQRCCGTRKVQCIFHHEDGDKVISLLLLLSGDVETNPGPGNN